MNGCRTSSEHQNGSVHEFSEGYTVFEDTQDFPAPPVFYSWVGDFGDHDRAEHSPLFDSMAKAQTWATARI